MSTTGAPMRRRTEPPPEGDGSRRNAGGNVPSPEKPGNAAFGAANQWVAAGQDRRGMGQCPARIPRLPSTKPKPHMTKPTRRQLANAIRFLAADAVEAAKSGHPGMPMGMADIAEVLWNDYLRHNPSNPDWFNRDRFVLSNGHGSMLHYALLHLAGYDLPIEELKRFRQLHSKTAGHPE